MKENFLSSDLRLLNNVLIGFVDENLIRMTNSNNEMLITHKDMLLLLPDFFKWTNVEGFLDQFGDEKDKICDVLMDMYFLGMLETKESADYNTLTSNDYLPQCVSGKESIFFNVHNHHVMIKDYARANSYRLAIEDNVTPEDVVLELGCGTGILTFFAARAGAKKLYAIEINKDLTEKVTKPLAKENGFEDKITFLLGNSMNIPASSISPKPTVFIAEILGDGVFNENILTYTIDARDRFLAPDARLIPQGLEVCLFPYENPMNQMEFSSSYLKRISQPTGSQITSLYLKYDSYSNKMLAPVESPVYLDLYTLKDTGFEVEGEFKINMPGKFNGVCLYFVAHLDKNHRLSNSPWSPQTSWTQQLFNINPPKMVQHGDIVKYKLVYDGYLNLILE